MSEYPAVSEMSFTSKAVVETDRPARYAKQLVSHMGRKVPSEEITDGHRLTFNREGNFNGYGDILVTSPNSEGEQNEQKLVLIAYAPDAQRLERVEGVLARHLERFGERDELKVNFLS